MYELNTEALQGQSSNVALVPMHNVCACNVNVAPPLANMFCNASRIRESRAGVTFFLSLIRSTANRYMLTMMMMLVLAMMATVMATMAMMLSLAMIVI